MLHDLVKLSRSYRRFDHHAPIPMETLEELIGLARLCPSAANRQPLRFILSTAPDDNETIFSCLRWAAYLADWDGPSPAEQPTAYVVIVNTAKDWEYAKVDLGIVAQTMLLGAAEKGLGGCMIAAFDREKLRGHFAVPADMEISLVLALGKPVEDVRIVDLADGGSIKYYRDEAGVHYVPKRSLAELILAKRA